jgi:lipoic acid synthetase
VTQLDVRGFTPQVSSRTLHVRWLGKVPYSEALDLQRSIWRQDTTDHLLLLEHPHTYTLGVRADMANVLVPPHTVGAELVKADRGGDVTYHGPGQLVGYPILSLVEPGVGRLARSGDYVCAIEQLIIDVLGDFGIRNASRMVGQPGVWLDVDTKPRKIAAVGVRLSRGRTMHGFALNVDPDLAMFNHIVPCGLAYPVTSMAAEGIRAAMSDIVAAVTARSSLLLQRFLGPTATVEIDSAQVAWKVRPEDLSAFTRGHGLGETVHEVGALGMTRGAHAATDPEPPPAPSSSNVRLVGRLAQVGVTGGIDISQRKPEWLRVKADMGDGYRRLKSIMRDLSLVTVCEEAGCPNIYECWADGTATFMINGERCTRACGFCLVDTQKPLELDSSEPSRVADAVEQMGLRFAVITAVARDDLNDGGAGAFAATIRAVQARTPNVQTEVLISDCKGHAESLDTIFAARPTILNHNIETVARLQRAVRPSAAYARSLAVLARAKNAGLTTKSGIIVGLGETDDEVRQTLVDLSAVGVSIVTIGQYLRPTTHHMPIARWVEPHVFDEYRAFGESLGISHVESSPLTRSSYHARQAASDAISLSSSSASSSFA